MPRLLSFYLHLYTSIILTLAQSPIQLDFYTGESCTEASTEHPSTAIPLGECLVTTGLISIHVEQVACTTGHVNIIGFEDTLCNTKLFYWDNYLNGCFDSGGDAIAAVLLTCVQEDDSGQIKYAQPTSTSTIAVGPVAEAAPTGTQTSAASASVGSSGFATSTSIGGGGATATHSSAATSATPATPTNGDGKGSSSSSSPPSSSSSSSSSSDSPSSGAKLSTSDIIAIAVGLGVGIPTIIIGIIGIRYARR